jgi:large subunit ribosomal protein L15
MAEQPKQPLLSRLSPPKGAVTNKKRIGRGPGSGKGTTAGFGQKGQRARSGGSIHPWFEGGQTPLWRRLPKRGFTNPFTKNVAVVNVGALSAFDKGATVDPEKLVEAGLLRGRFDSVKVLGTGTLDKALTVRAHAFSKGAKERIEQAGGKAEVIEAQASEPATQS